LTSSTGIVLIVAAFFNFRTLFVVAFIQASTFSFLFSFQ